MTTQVLKQCTRLDKVSIWGYINSILAKPWGGRNIWWDPTTDVQTYDENGELKGLDTTKAGVLNPETKKLPALKSAF